jgi:phytanoyl-CoA hydroxylase
VTPIPQPSYAVSVDEFVRFRQQGYLVVKSLVPAEDVAAFNQHIDRLLSGEEELSGARVMQDIGKEPRPGRTEDWLRVHMLHRISAVHERVLLHPRILDVLEALIGPDVLALQSMLFFKQPGQPGQGYHQDSYYIPTFPDTLCGAWVAVSPATIQNGCLWFTPGSQHEPVYPDARGLGASLSSNIADLGLIANASSTDESINGLLRVARRYPGQEVAVEADPGDVVFFGGHILHRSHTNLADFPRRSFVGHYCNARSWVPWNHGEPFEGEAANNLHILARGRTHLPFAQPKFGTPCAANQPALAAPSGQPASMMASASGMMGLAPHSPDPED